jgi:hypothetical protein
MIFRGSRYETVQTTQGVTANGRVIAYLRMRFIPATPGLPGYSVQQGDRPDLVAFRILGDPEQFWRLCDANTIQHPADLTSVPGTRIWVAGPRTG